MKLSALLAIILIPTYLCGTLYRAEYDLKTGNIIARSFSLPSGPEVGYTASLGIFAAGVVLALKAQDEEQRDFSGKIINAALVTLGGTAATHVIGKKICGLWASQ